jgi:Ca2+-binding RTX toxin-like protein
LTLNAVAVTASDNVSVTGTTGADTLTGGGGADSLIGDDGDDTLTGNGGADSLIGDDGDDTLTGNGGADSLNGGDGDDILVSDDTDVILGGNNTDTAVFGAAVSSASLSDADLVGVERIEITNAGNAAYDFSLQSDGFVIVGGTGNDTITGSTNGDTITGGTGADVLNGGAGADQYRYLATTDGSTTPGSGDEIAIANFTSGTDSIGFADAAFGGLGTGALTAAADTAFRADQATTLNDLAAKADSEVYRATFTGTTFNQAFYDDLDAAMAGVHTGAAFFIITNGADGRILFDADTSTDTLGSIVEIARFTGMTSVASIATSDLFIF